MREEDPDVVIHFKVAARTEYANVNWDQYELDERILSLVSDSFLFFYAFYFSLFFILPNNEISSGRSSGDKMSVKLESWQG
jgi:hypothetical protein